MKKILNHTLILLAGAALMLSCAKEVQLVDGIDNGSKISVSDKDANKELVTITATLPENLATLSPAIATKVSFEPNISGGKTTSMSPVWEAGDAIRIYNHADHSDYSDFELTTGAGTATAKFSGTLPGGSSYDAEVMDASGDDPEAMIVQPSDGVAPEIKYFATATDFTDISAISFTTTTGILALSAKMPADVAGGISSVSIKSSEAIFPGGDGKSLTIGIGEPGDTGSDNILNLFAPITAGTNVPAGTSLLVQFNALGTDHTVYTRYVELGATTFTAGKVSTINVNAVNSASYANASTTGIGTSANPYLIGDGYQLAAVNGLATGGQTTYFKMIDDVDMTGITHNQINTNSGYTQFVNFDGNNKTISNLGKNLFYVFKGSIQNLTLSDSSVGTARGIFAEYCQGTGHTITNVDITGGSMASISNNSGAMIGRVNNGTSGSTTVTISDCDITNTTVGGAQQTGGLIGSADAQVVVDNCNVEDSPITASGVNSGGLIGQTTGVVTISDCTVSGTDVTGTGVVGGAVGFANSLVTISGCKYTGGTLTASARYIGGFLGSTKDEASVITDCQVEAATINANYTDDSRGGGFVGQLQTSCRVEGCTVGTPSQKVTVNTKQPKRTGSGTTEDPYVYSKINSGGFVGVNYGTITKNGNVRSMAYVKITSNNTYATALDLGGFVGFGRGNIEYSDAIVDMTNLKGQYIGGFAGYVVNAGTVIDNCTVDGAVTGNNYTGGFAGYVDSGAPVISNCIASGSVSGQSGSGAFVGQTMTGVFTDCSTAANFSGTGTNNGGFVGQIHGGTMTRCSATGSVTATGGSAYGGFVGLMPKGTTLTDCWAGGNVTGVGNHIGGFVGIINSTDAVNAIDIIHCHASGGVSNSSKGYNGGFCGSISQGNNINIKKCYASGNVTSDQSTNSAFIGYIYKGQGTPIVNVTVENCYATGNIINSNQIRGGLIGQIAAADGVTISNCYASGAVVGTFRLGGLIGNINIADVTVEHCAAWNSEITASNHGNGNWSSGALVGTAFPTCTLTDNYRKPDISLLAFWGNVSGYTWELASDYNHPNVSSSSPLVISEIATGTLRATTATALASGQDNYPQFAYHGKVEAGKTLSQLASTTLGWSSDIWDFTGDLPTLK